ncbi:hypothetical protein BH10ACT7_BH10ACT7_25770 [soil metagenome]
MTMVVTIMETDTDSTWHRLRDAYERCARGVLAAGGWIVPGYPDDKGATR